ncbi:hypothetical protein B5X24_HaOG215923 [Helicoverpa armigera]|nr:hypothetical protein B5X24_HaOG215923 [Helicoverpa armigera]
MNIKLPLSRVQRKSRKQQQMEIVSETVTLAQTYLVVAGRRARMLTDRSTDDIARNKMLQNTSLETEKEHVAESQSNIQDIETLKTSSTQLIRIIKYC